jgi:phosphoenolpyruvate carboxylase
VAFFRTRLEMLEMVFLKADLWLAEYCDTRLVPQELWASANSCVRSLPTPSGGAEAAPAG